jgi:hypothetical protein
VPEQIGIGIKASDWAEKIIRRSKTINLNENRNSDRNPDDPLEFQNRASGLNTSSDKNKNLRDKDELAGDSKSLNISKVLTDEKKSQIGNPSAGKKPISPEELANKVYRLMQKDLHIEIERMGR